MIVTYEIRKIRDDGQDVCYFTSYEFDCVMQQLWDKYKYETGCYLVIKVPNMVDNGTKKDYNINVSKKE